MTYWGEAKCKAKKANGDACVNGAYYELDGMILCGVHSGGKKKEKRVLLLHNLRICGYDAYEVKENMKIEEYEECYLDISRPFGHELVLYTMFN